MFKLKGAYVTEELTEKIPSKVRFSSSEIFMKYEGGLVSALVRNKEGKQAGISPQYAFATGCVTEADFCDGIIRIGKSAVKFLEGDHKGLPKVHGVCNLCQNKIDMERPTSEKKISSGGTDKEDFSVRR